MFASGLFKLMLRQSFPINLSIPILLLPYFWGPQTTTMNFLQLPQELRLLTYSELLVQPDPIIFIEYFTISDPDIIFEEYEAPDFPLPLRSSGDGLCPALLQVNKQIYNEAIPVLYSENTLQFPTKYLCTGWDKILPYRTTRSASSRHTPCTYSNYQPPTIETSSIPKRCREKRRYFSGNPPSQQTNTRGSYPTSLFQQPL